MTDLGPSLRQRRARCSAPAAAHRAPELRSHLQVRSSARRYPPAPASGRQHVDQTDLTRRCIELATDPGEVVFDPCAGNPTTPGYRWRLHRAYVLGGRGVCAPRRRNPHERPRLGPGRAGNFASRLCPPRRGGTILNRAASLIAAHVVHRLGH